uniref:Potassium/proton antiporter CemA n=1 Tax=Lacunastrum gracillimum TaxID=427913 RepID=A0A2U8GH36_9CHLO|nr:chloroplast envelope membrane protein [Lacunastrum gracillimum]AWI68024.1 chloroplast envelope membrane protein [Lacunastrum gracillimum]
MNKKTNNKLNLFNLLFKYINLSFLTSNKINNQSHHKNSKIYSKMNSQYDEDKSLTENQLNILNQKSLKSKEEKYNKNLLNKNVVGIKDNSYSSFEILDRSFDSFMSESEIGFSESNNSLLRNEKEPKERSKGDYKELPRFKKNDNKNLKAKDKRQTKQQNSKLYSNIEVFNENINADSPFNKKNFSYKEKLNTSPSKSRFIETSKQQVVSITYEEIGLFPRSFNRVFDRFFKQLFFDVENLVIQEYRFYRYLFLTTVKCVFILLFVPLTINFIAKNYFVRPIAEYYWNSHQMEIFLNSYQQKRAFTELKNFEEKIYFESLIFPMNPSISLSSFLPENTNESLSFSSFGIDNSERRDIKDCSFASAHSLQLCRGKSESEHERKGEPKLMKCASASLLQSEREKADATNSDSERSERKPMRTMLTSDIPKLATQIPNEMNSDFAKGLVPQKKVISFGIRDCSESEIPKEQSLIPKKQYWIPNEAKFVNINEQEKIKQNSKFSQMFTQSIQKRLQLQTVELAKHYNEESIEAITNFFADLISLSTLFVLLKLLEIQINITKSFLLEVFFGLDDSKKSLLILFITDLLVGYHSPNIWELFFSTIFDHYGLPESQTTIFLLVATLPVLLDVLFKYLIFRHLNRASPATVATYHAMIE